MNAMFKEIRQGDIEKVKARIEKNPDVVNEVFTGKKPLKDIGQSPAPGSCQVRTIRDH